MKKITLSLIAMMVAMFCFAQDALVATLTKDTVTTVFYGTNALSDALEKAEADDVINLSGGKFQAVTITKAVSIRCTGVDAENPTILTEVNINLNADSLRMLKIEGCHISKLNVQSILGGARFVKSDIHNVGNVYNLKKTSFINCKVTSITLANNCSADFYNSYIHELRCNDNSKSSIVNCVLNNSYYLANSTIVNSILNSNWYSYILPASAYVSHCIVVGYYIERALQNVSGEPTNYYADISIFTDSDLEKDLTLNAKEES